MYNFEYCKIINKINLVHKIKEEINSANDYIVIGEITLDNTESYTYFDLTFKNEYIESEYKDKIKTRFKHDEIPGEYMIVNEIGIRARAYDDVKYFDCVGNLLFSYSWCE